MMVIHLSTLVIPCVELAAAPASDKLLHPVAVQVVGEDGGGLMEDNWKMAQNA